MRPNEYLVILTFLTIANVMLVNIILDLFPKEIIDKCQWTISFIGFTVALWELIAISLFLNT